MSKVKLTATFDTAEQYLCEPLQIIKASLNLWVFNRESSDRWLENATKWLVAAEFSGRCLWPCTHVTRYAKHVHSSPVSPGASGSQHDINSLTGFAALLTSLCPPSAALMLPFCGSPSRMYFLVVRSDSSPIGKNVFKNLSWINFIATKLLESLCLFFLF